MYSTKPHLPAPHFMEEFPWRSAAWVVLVLSLVLMGALAVRWLTERRSAITLDTAVESTSALPHITWPATPCVGSHCGVPWAVASSLPTELDLALSLDPALQGAPQDLLFPSRPMDTGIPWVSLRSSNGPNGPAPGDGSLAPRAAPTEGTRPAGTIRGVARVPPAVAGRDTVPFSSVQLQNLVGARANRLVSDYLHGRRGGSRDDVTRVALTYALLPGCKLTVDQVNVRADSRLVTAELEAVIRQGLTQRLDAGGCGKLRGKVAGDITVINVRADQP